VDALNGKVGEAAKCDPSNDPTPGCSKKANGKPDSSNSPLFFILFITLRSHTENRNGADPKFIGFIGPAGMAPTSEPVDIREHATTPLSVHSKSRTSASSYHAFEQP